jgi:hypothetical protein
VAWLETQLGTSKSHQSQDPLSAIDEPISASPMEGSPKTEASSSAAPNFANCVRNLSLQAAEEPQNFGVSSGVSLAHMIEAAVYSKASPSSSLNLSVETDSGPSTNTLKAQITTAALPSFKEGVPFINAYLSTIHPDFPFLSKRKLWDIHRNSKNLEGNSNEEAKFDFIVLQLVYAIGSRCLQLVGSPSATGVEPEGHYASAVAKIQDRLINVPSVQNIQIMLLVAIYALRCPSGTF